MLTDFNINDVIVFGKSEEKVQEFVNRLNKVNQEWNKYWKPKGHEYRENWIENMYQRDLYNKYQDSSI